MRVGGLKKGSDQRPFGLRDNRDRRKRAPWGALKVRREGTRTKAGGGTRSRRTVAEAIQGVRSGGARDV